MPRTIRRAAEFDQASSFEDAVEDGFGKIGIVQDQAPRRPRLVGGEKHRAAMQVALVDDLEHEVGGVTAHGEIAHFVNHRDGRVGVAREGRGQIAAPGGD
jgi:hypothetical protein